MKKEDGFSDIEVEDVSSSGFGSGKDKKSFKSIILQHYDCCIKEGSKEMTTGGVMKRVIEGEVVEIIVPNQIQIFINHVQMLKRALWNKIEDYPNIAKEANSIELKRLNLIKRYKQRKQILTKHYFNLSPKVNYETGLSQMDVESASYRKMFNNLNEVYNLTLLELHQELLFPLLTRLIAEMNYFEEEGTTV